MTYKIVNTKQTASIIKWSLIAVDVSTNVHVYVSCRRLGDLVTSGD